MTISDNELKNIAALAYLKINPTDAQHLINSINTLTNIAEKLRQIDTTNVQPLLHPLDLTQRLRKDEVSEKNEAAELKKVAPEFYQEFYIVPKIVENS